MVLRVALIVMVTGILSACGSTKEAKPVSGGETATAPALTRSSGPASETQARREIETLRRDKDRNLQSAADSPIPVAERADFKGLKYFPIDPSYRVEAELKHYQGNEKVQMLTSSGQQQEYVRYGYFEFKVGTQTCKLDVFKPTFLGPNTNHLFIPFRDATSGKESYGAGRYLELAETPDTRYTLDFNLAYNPYCAYNKQYSCPLPPKQNTLAVEIRAGEKNYKEEK